MMSPRLRFISLGAVLAVLSLTSCNALDRIPLFKKSDPQVEQQPTATQSLVVSPAGRLLRNAQGQVELLLPTGWQADGRLNERADLQASNELLNLYVIVLSENKGALSQFTLGDNSSYYRRLLVQGLTKLESQQITNVTVIDGKPAVQYEIRGELEGQKVVYLHTTMATDDRYYQIVSWTKADLYNQHRQELQNVIGSFREI